MEIGTDIEQIDRFENKSNKFLEEAFAKEEIDYAKKFKNEAEHYCAFWCVKEAVIKAFSNPKIPFLQIVTLHDEFGKPYIMLNETIKTELKKQGFEEIKISISHSKSYATAVCVLN